MVVEAPHTTLADVAMVRFVVLDRGKNAGWQYLGWLAVWTE